jgi:predicted acyltransferase
MEPKRLASLDAFRGLTMLYMASEILQLPKIAKNFEGNALWQFVDKHWSHVEWVGWSFWDLIQPSFMFMVGVALPFSLASRRAKGQSFARMLSHALYRSVALIALGIFLRSD